MKCADKFQAPWCVLIGDQEVFDNQVIIKNMKTGSQDRIAQDQVIPELIQRIGKENIQHYRE
jgi:histidyl-tRNA synthetase